VLGEVSQYLAHINVKLTSLPLAHIGRQVNVLATESAQFILLGQRFKGKHVFPLVA